MPAAAFIETVLAWLVSRWRLNAAPKRRGGEGPQSSSRNHISSQVLAEEGGRWHTN
jgi:hypothetical protein